VWGDLPDKLSDLLRELNGSVGLNPLVARIPGAKPERVPRGGTPLLKSTHEDVKNDAAHHFITARVKSMSRAPQIDLGSILRHAPIVKSPSPVARFPSSPRLTNG
jgi:hypothetical protein